MIKLSDALITDGLPEFLGEQPRVKALAYALNKQIKQLVENIEKLRIYSGFYLCSERVLDMLAFELKIPKYKDTFDIEIKRRMVANGYFYWSHMGTVKALEDLCSDIFQSAEVNEWFNYGGTAGHFKISTDNFNITSENVNEFKEVVNQVKRLSAHLDEIELILSTPPLKQTRGFALHIMDEISLTCAGKIYPHYSDAMRQGYPMQMHTGDNIILQMEED